ncbi:MAG: hypothetical protein LBG83_04735 [Oscillospiraceae bacterium]|nr:hypothetical protein [Oscillospiraceae bacterium]
MNEAAAKVFQLLVGSASGVIVELAVTAAAKAMWGKIKSFFRGNKAIPAALRMEVAETNPPDRIEAASLRKILSEIPGNDLSEWLTQVSPVGSQQINITGPITHGSVGAVTGGSVTINNNSLPPAPTFEDGKRLLQQRNYEAANEVFAQVSKQANASAEIFYYAAISLLRGKSAFVTLRLEIDKIENYIKAALMIEPRGIYFYFQAYIKYDYFERKCFNTSPTWRQALSDAKRAGLLPLDVQRFYQLLKVPCPSCLQIQ